jgi:hypothetical protein
MPMDRLGDHAERFLTAACTHRECRGGRIVSVDEMVASIELHINVEMPLHMRVDGVSESGVRRMETVTARLSIRYPWSPPTFFLREDFPRDLPHLQPGPLTELPRPCLVDGNEREYFIQLGLVELGIFNLVHQLVLWLHQPAEGTLIDPEQGLEPSLRRDLSAEVVMDAEACRAIVDRNGGYRVLRARYLRVGSDDSIIGPDSYALVDVEAQRIPLSQNNDELLTHSAGDRCATGNTVCCVAWPDKLPSGGPCITETYMPETVTSYGDLLARAEEIGCGRSLRGFFQSLERCFLDRAFKRPTAIPVAIVLCARRPLCAFRAHPIADSDLTRSAIPI